MMVLGHFSPDDRTKMTGSDEIPLLLKSGAQPSPTLCPQLGQDLNQ